VVNRETGEPSGKFKIGGLQREPTKLPGRFSIGLKSGKEGFGQWEKKYKGGDRKISGHKRSQEREVLRCEKKLSPKKKGGKRESLAQTSYK